MALALVACKKEDEKPMSKTELLTAKNWRLTADKRTSNGQTTTVDVYPSLPDCAKDDYYKYSTNNKAELNAGAFKCSSSQAQSYVINWNFSSDETKLVTSDPSAGWSVNSEILELTASTLRLKNNQSGGGTQELTFTAF
ncbi:lipocalin family protein [Solirubrum puertoriconensis]|uniref:lipocalin family protein n=1 Tax=Solirubrum puertoriconensis TaxID=1751427 RepID=UPI00122E4407|nr:lipocalin family protein [Solirubrum puertoriconensis]